VERALLKDRALRWPGADAFLQQLGASAPAAPVPADEPAAVAPVPALPAYAEEDALTTAFRPAAQVDEVWRATAAGVEQRTHARRRRTAVLATAAALTLGGLTATAALFATMGEDGRFVTFAPSAAATPEPTGPAARPSAPAVPVPAAATPPAPETAAPARPPVDTASTPDSARTVAAPRPAAAETAPRAGGPAAKPARSRRGGGTAEGPARRRRPPANAGRTAPRASARPSAALPAREVAAPEPRVLGKPKLLGISIDQLDRTVPARTGTVRSPR